MSVRSPIQNIPQNADRFQTALAIDGVFNAGFKGHTWDAPPKVTIRAGLYGWISMMLFLASMCLTKTSVLLFFLRLVNKSHHPALYWTAVAGIIINVLSFFAFAFVLIFACKPISAAWLAMDWRWPDEYDCAPREMSDLMNGVTSILTDIYAVVLPVFIVSKLRLSRAQKTLLYVVFCCGLIVIGASIARSVYGKRMYTDSSGDLMCKCSFYSAQKSTNSQSN